MPHYIITGTEIDGDGRVTDCVLRPIVGGTEAAPTFRSDGAGTLESADQVRARLRAGDTVWVLRERDGHRLPPDALRIRKTPRGEVLQAYAIASDVETDALQQLAL